MSQSARNHLVAVAVAALLILAAAALLTEDPLTKRRSLSANETEHPDTTADTRTPRKNTRTRAGTGSATNDRPTSRSSDDAITSGVQLLPVMQASSLPPLAGYTVDSFESWTTIPAAYISDGIILRNGTITLADAGTSATVRSGQLVSPPLPLNSPALSGAAQSSRPIPDGASLTLEISLSEDGTDWTSWTPIAKYTPPDGKRVTAPFQAAISQAELAAAAGGSTVSPSLSGPSLRYRLSLSATGPAAPAIADIRIWKRELH